MAKKTKRQQYKAYLTPPNMKYYKIYDGGRDFKQAQRMAKDLYPHIPYIYKLPKTHRDYKAGYRYHVYVTKRSNL